MADNVAITAGSGTAIATDEVPGTLEHVQLFKLAYSADGVRTLVPADANGLLVKDSAPTYDSGLTAVPDVLTAITAATIRARGLLMVNLTAALKTLSLTNTAGAFYLKDYPIQPGMSEYLPLGDSQMVGAKWQASVAASVNAQLVGNL